MKRILASLLIVCCVAGLIVPPQASSVTAQPKSITAQSSSITAQSSSVTAQSVYDLLPSGDHYDSERDFSTTQGQGNWYYMAGNVVNPDPSTFELCPATVAWEVVYWQSQNAYYTLVGQTKFVIGNVNWAPIKAWKAPYTGKITYSVTSELNSTSPRMTNNIFTAAGFVDTYQAGEKATKTYTLDVNAGDYVYFAMSPTDGVTDNSLVFATIKVNYSEIAESDKAAFNAIAAEINSIPAEVSLSDREKIMNCFNSLNAMGSVGVTFVGEAAVSKLMDAYAAVYALEFSEMVESLPSPLTLESKSDVEAARQFYDNLKDESKAKVSEDTLNALVEAEETIADLLVPQGFEPLVNAIPDNVTLEDKETVLTAKKAFEEMTSVEQSNVDAALKEKLQNAINVIMELQSDANMTFSTNFGFSAEAQGKYGWYYEYEQDGVYKQMSSDGTQWNGGEGFANNHVNGVHVGASVGVIKTLVAPYSGIVDISGYAYKDSAEGCRVNIFVRKNGEDLFADDPIEMLTPEMFNYEKSVKANKTGIEVEKGDRISICYYSADGYNAFGTVWSIFDITYTKVLDDTLTTPHLVELSGDTPDEIIIGKPIKLDGNVIPSENASRVKFTVLSAQNSKAVDAFVDDIGKVHVFVPGDYILCAYDTETKVILYKHEFKAVQDTSGKTNNSYLEYDDSFTIPQVGKGNWYYMYQDGEGFTEMSKVFNGISWQGVYTYSLLGRQETFCDIGPDNPTRAWKAPLDGKIDFAVVGRMAAGNPLAFDVYINNELKGSFVPDGGAPVGISGYGIEVNAGDYIYIVAKNAGYGTASADLRITANVTYTEISSAAYENVNALINALPSEDKFTREIVADLKAAKAAYDNLTTTEKAFIDSIAEEKIAALEELAAAFEVIDAIDALPAIENITLADTDKVQSARDSYEGLTAAHKEYVSNYNTLVEAEAKIENLRADHEAAKAVEDKIDDIPANITLVDRLAVNLAKDAYDALSEERKALVDPDKVDALNAALAKIEILTQEKNEVESVEALINALPAANNLTLANKDAVDAAKSAFDALKDHQKSAVANAEKLNSAVTRIGVIIAAQESADAVEKLITAIPGEPKLTDKAAVEAARAAYDALSDEAKTYVENYDSLRLAEATIESLEVTKAAADAVIAKIAALPAELKLTDKEAVEAARAAYAALSDDAKALVTNVSDLEAAEAAIESIEKATAGIYENGQLVAYYASVTEAAAAANGKVVTILADTAEEVTISADVTIDLAGHTLSNVIVSDGATLTLIDTATDDYEGEYGSATVTGTVETFAQVDGKTYLTVAQDGAYSAHCYDVAITHISLDAANDALGYKAQLFGDDVVQSHVESFGYNLWLDGGQVKTYEKTGSDVLTLRLKNILKNNGGEMNINATAFVNLAVGENTHTETCGQQTITMKETLQRVNAAWDSFTATQQAAVKALCESYYDTVSAWMLHNIYPGAEAETMDLKLRSVTGSMGQAGGFTVSNGQLTAPNNGEGKAILSDTPAGDKTISVDLYPNGSINSGIYLGASDAAAAQDSINGIAVIVESVVADNPNRVDILIGNFPVWAELHRYVIEGDAALFTNGVKEPVTLTVVQNGNDLTVTVALISDPSKSATTTYTYTGSYDLSNGQVGLRSQYNDCAFDNFQVSCGQLGVDYSFTGDADVDGLELYHSVWNEDIVAISDDTLAFHEAAFTNGVLTMDINTNGNKEAGVVFGADAEGNSYYLFRLTSDGHVELVKVENGVETLLKRTALPAGHINNSFNRLEIVRNGNQIACYYYSGADNANCYIICEDAQTWTGDCFGFRAKTSGAIIRNITLSA